MHEKTQDINCTFLTTGSLILEHRLLQKQPVYRTSSFPDLAKGLEYTLQKESGLATGEYTPPPSDVKDDQTLLNEAPRASTPVEGETDPKKLYKKIRIKDILFHPDAFCIPGINIVATPAQGQRHNYLL